MKADVRKVLARSPKLQDVQSIPLELRHKRFHAVAAFRASAKVGDRVVDLQIVVDHRFPLSKPLLFLADPNALGYIPHVERNGYICYATEEGFLVDINRPEDVILDCVETALKVLEDGVAGTNRADFWNEFEAYWLRSATGKMITFTSPGETVCELPIMELREISLLVVGENIAQLHEFVMRCFKHRVTPRLVPALALYVPLAWPLRPPGPGTVWSLEHLLHILQWNTLPPNRNVVQRILRQRKLSEGQSLHVLLSLPTTHKARSLVGVRVERIRPVMKLKRKTATSSHASHHVRSNSQTHRVESTNEAEDCIASCQGIFDLNFVDVLRYDREYVTHRGGGQANLYDKHVVIMGCGAVGSHVAMELSRGGIGHLTLVDKDQMHVENTYRHALGINRVHSIIQVNGRTVMEYVPKAYGLSRELKERFPYVQVTPLWEYVEEFVDPGSFDRTTCDLIVVALGDPNLELYLNRCFHQLGKRVPVIYTWVEPLGIGGHALVTRNRDGVGCFECLYIDPEAPDERMYNRASFAAHNQSFAITLRGCNDYFTPYGSIDAVQTALLTTRLALDVLTGKEQGNPLLSWKGHDDSFVRLGYSLSPRYHFTSEELYESRYQYASHLCTVCHTASQ